MVDVEDWMILILLVSIAIVAMYIKKRKKVKNMPAGIQIFDANGNKTLDYTESLTRISGVICPRTVTGSYTIDNPNNERIWLDVYSINTTTDRFSGIVQFPFPLMEIRFPGHIVHKAVIKI